MEIHTLSSLKEAIIKDIAPELRFRNRFAIFFFIVVLLSIITWGLLYGEKSITLAARLWLLVVPLGLFLIFLLEEKSMEKRIIRKAEKMAMNLIRIKMVRIFINYFGADRIRFHKGSIAKILLDIQGIELCTLRGHGDKVMTLFTTKEIVLCSELKLEPLKHIIKQNGKAVIIISFEITDKGEMFMNYYRNEDPGDFKEHQFPCRKK